MMGAPVASEAFDAEIEFLERMRSRYEAEGFTFTVLPDRAKLPAFLGPYIPDALAQKPGRNIAIEVKTQPSRATQMQIEDTRRLFEDHPDWQFAVFYRGTDSARSALVPPASPQSVRERVGEARELVEQGHRRAAFVMAWSLLEAALHAVEETGGGKPRAPGTVVQSLAMNGYIDADAERRLRGLIPLRNRVVHGDLGAEPSAADVEILLTAAEETLRAEANA